MAKYAVGDIQGCLGSLKKVLSNSPYQKDKDQLWFVGDLVNRGPQSLETLRYVKSLGKRAKVVLGNHDLHLLALHAGVKEIQNTATLDPILNAPDCDELLNWLRRQPLMITDKKSHCVLVHAGIYPYWSLAQAQSYAAEVEEILQSDDYCTLLKEMYGKRPVKWKPQLKGWNRYRFIINAFTRMRFCTKQGGLNFVYNSAPGSQPNNLYPWYRLGAQPRGDWRIIFGHWSSAGHWYDGNHVALDSGCLWGGQMTLAKVSGRKIKVYQHGCQPSFN
ncbi:MAG: bis(5'-nucleosyl)-tetraphosphatase (symmetrical) [Saprospiraceae bacterium]|jgi:bis(5'-nucleosyl)-tetraphosphatase (symmetrical)